MSRWMSNYDHRDHGSNILYYYFHAETNNNSLSMDIHVPKSQTFVCVKATILTVMKWMILMNSGLKIRI